MLFIETIVNCDMNLLNFINPRWHEWQRVIPLPFFRNESFRCLQCSSVLNHRPCQVTVSDFLKQADFKTQIISYFQKQTKKVKIPHTERKQTNGVLKEKRQKIVLSQIWSKGRLFFFFFLKEMIPKLYCEEQKSQEKEGRVSRQRKNTWKRYRRVRCPSYEGEMGQ